MECELCGRSSSNLKSVTVEGSLLMACDDCASYGTENKVYSLPKDIAYSAPPYARKIVSAPKELAENYGTLIRKARQQRNWTIEDLAKKVFIKNSTMQRIESQALLPEEKMIPRIESLLGIRLKKAD